MLVKLATYSVRHRRRVLWGTVVLAAVSAVVGGSTASELSAGGQSATGVESSEAAEILRETFGTQYPNLALLVTVREGTVDDEAAVAAGLALTESLSAEGGITQVSSYWSLANAPPLRGEDDTSALVVAVLTGSDSQISDTAARISDEYTSSGTGPIDVAITGLAGLNNTIERRSEQDLVRAERIALPITLVLLVLTFGSLVAAAIPMLFGVVSLVGTLMLLRILLTFTSVSVFALNLATALGFALAVDYSLFVVTRFRSELRAGRSPEAAAIAAAATAGRTVVFSAVVVAISLAALLVFPVPVMRSLAMGGCAVTFLAAVIAIVPLPAALAAMGPRVDSLRLWRRNELPQSMGAWERISRAVARRPLVVALTAVVVLLTLALPFRGIEFGLLDERVLPEGDRTRRAMSEIREVFSSGEASAMPVVLPNLDAGEQAADLEDYALRLSAIEGVARVDAATGSYTEGARIDPALLPPGLAQILQDRRAGLATDGATWLSVVPSGDPQSETSDALVRNLRAVPAPSERFVGGVQAEFVDLTAVLKERLPIALAIIGVVTFVLLALMFGSLIVPLKALVLNLFSLTATFGAMVYIFQDGHFASVLQFTPTGTIYPAMVVLVFCVAFGLSMDYEVFLLAPMKEEFDRTGDNRRAVDVGLQRSGRLVTAAALIISVVLVSFATSGLAVLKLLGVGLALAILIDAFVIRATLVPAAMHLMRRGNWWGPAWLKRIARLRHEAYEPTEPPDPATPSEPALTGAR